ncbi:zinc protease [Pedobacter steynii]|uniref:Zinc protease n=1 Tax=Pedobacter steynii TaxID=430522 RepID=A0A1G9PBR4_9SPHI|nr:M16 family metallopeptidase [Pedobacter steynii]NQX39030.1 insulinase family protein [Pedobacter steynii]SDL96256.1 zinc protease [Pedobacter steynii]
MKLRYLLVWAVISCSIFKVKGQELPLDPKVRTGKLSNGFTYFIRHNQEPKNRVVMYLANKVGSILETDAQVGLAHFTEHMSFNGTKHYPKSELVSYLQKVGVRFGADLNAYTGFDETVYQLPLPSDNPEILNNGIQIMRDWAQEAILDTEDINNERGVIMEEMRLGKGASERMQRKTLPLLLNRSRYASRLPIGTEQVLFGFKPDVIRTFYRDWYRPNLQALIIVGDIDVNEMEKIIKSKFSDLKNPDREKPRTRYTVPLTGKNQFIVVTDKETPQTVMQIIVKHKAKQVKTALDYRGAMVRSLFNQILGGRYTELSKKEGTPYLNGGAGIKNLMGLFDTYETSVVAKPGELEKGFKAVWRECRRIQLFGFTQSELDRAKLNYLNGMEESMKEKDKIRSDAYVNEYLQFFLKQTAAPGFAKENELVTGFIPGITLRELNAVVKEYIIASNRDILIMAPEKDRASLPDENKVLSWIKGVDGEKLENFKDSVSTLPLLIHTPLAGKIVNEAYDQVLGIKTLVLSNGVRVILKKTDFKNNEILFNGFSKGGTSLYSDADYQTAVNAASIVSLSGVGNYNSIQLNKFLLGKQVNVAPYVNELVQGFNGITTIRDLETSLQLVYGYFTEPRKDVTVFEGLTANAKSRVVNRGSSPDEVFSDTLNAVLGNYNIRRTGPTLEKINQINLDKAIRIYKERFADASGFTFTFTGSIDEEKIKPLLETYLGSLPSTYKKQEFRSLGIHIPEGNISKTVYKGAEQKANVYLVFSGKFDYTYENRIKLDAIKAVLEIRMVERLREEESGVYTPSVKVNSSKYPEERFSLVVSFGCAPANVERLVAAALDEVASLGSNGSVQINVDKYRAEATRQHESGLTTNGFWLSYITGQLLNNDPLDQVFGFDTLINQISTSSVRETAKKYLTGKNLIKLILLPEK